MNLLESAIPSDLSSIIGRPEKGIIFSDMDGVWLDEANNFAYPDAQYLESISKARENGYWTVLISDTAPQTLATYAAELGANPWVIAENGAVVFIPDVGYWYTSSNTERTPFLKTNALQRLKDENPSAYFWQGDATPFIQRNEKIPEALAGQTVYVVNDMRIASIGIYTRVVSPDGILQIDESKTEETEQILNAVLRESNLDQIFRCKRYPLIGSCLVKDPTITKDAIVGSLIKQFGPNLSYWMLGDTVNDSMATLQDNIRVGAVGNADFDLKLEAIRRDGITAPRGYQVAKGADYIVNQILIKEDV